MEAGHSSVIGPWRSHVAHEITQPNTPADKIVDGQKSQSTDQKPRAEPRTRGHTLGSTMPSPPPPPMSPLSKCCRCCSSPSPPESKLQRAAESNHKPVCGARVPITATRRAHAASLLGLAGAAVWAPAVRAEENSGGEEGVLGAIKSIFDPNEKTKAGKVLPKAYLKAAREVVRTLRDSLEEDDGGDIAKFRRNADAAKESIREFLGGWRGQQAVAAEESYVALEKAIRSLAEFYSKAGPSASLPQAVKNKILDYLNTAEAYL